MVLIVSEFYDTNVFQFFCHELNVLWKFLVKNPGEHVLFLKNYNPKNPANVWRLDLFKTLVPTITENPPTDMKQVRLETDEWDYMLIDPHKYITKYETCDFYAPLAERIKKSLGVTSAKGEYVLYIKRETSRVLYDHKTKDLFENLFTKFCESKEIPYKVASFDSGVSFREQAELASSAKVIVSVHGAALTNAFLLPAGGHIIEINFRRFWHCDPVCFDHFSGKIKYTAKCAGKPSWRPFFHKAEFHNMALLFKKRYTEFDIEDAENFQTCVPVYIEKMYVDGDKLLRTVEEAYLAGKCLDTSS